jgi:hypothetical protein
LHTNPDLRDSVHFLVLFGTNTVRDALPHNFFMSRNPMQRVPIVMALALSILYN